MSFLDVLLFIFCFSLIFNMKRIESKKEIFTKDTTNTLRGVAMIGIVIHHIWQKTGLHSYLLGSVGYLATALFFFISGYGNSISINKSENVSIKWLWKRLIKIYVPFILAFLIFIVSMYIRNEEMNVLEIFKDFLIVSLPGMINWFPKVILGCFIIHYIVNKMTKNKVKQSTIIICLSIIYIILMKIFGLPSYWYNSMLCYGIGSLFTNFNFEKVNKLFLFSSSTIIFFLLFIGKMIYNIQAISIIDSVWFCVVLFMISGILKFKNRFYNFIGTNSFEFYLMHLIWLNSFLSICEKNTYIYTCLVLVSTYLSVLLYVIIKKQIESKRK